VSREFRFVVSTPRYEESLAFYGERLGHERVGGWDRGADDRGTFFAANGGIIEVMVGPPEVRMVIEVEDVDALGLGESEQEAGWDANLVFLKDPNDVPVVFFSLPAPPRPT
jgi:catechol 2,3-dioxygenase-like lactoylglutathione lyase family enzyme